MESEKLAYSTVKGIFHFIEHHIKNEKAKLEILNHIEEIFSNWDSSWNLIRTWLLEIQFSNKEQVLVDFINRIPQLQPFEDLVIQLFTKNNTFLSAVYETLFECKNLLIK